MVEEEEEEEEEEKQKVTEIPQVVVESFTGWERIQCPLPPPPRQHQSQSPSPSNEWSIVGVNINHSIMTVFPPINHEGLHISSFHSHHENYHGEIDQSLPDDDFEHASSQLVLPIARPKPAVSEVLARWWDLGIEFLRCKVNCIASTLRNYSASTRGGGGFVWSIRSPAAGAPTVAVAMLLVLWYLRSQRQRRRLGIRSESRDHLIRIIREKDEKIDKLLRQIAQMNEIFLALHRVPPTPRTD